MSDAIAAVLVTYNRQRLLADCLTALLGQTRPPDRIILIDNASTDGTAEWLQAQGHTHHPRIACLRLPENRGGAGGFHAGVQQGFNQGYDWFWLMDDDACPQPDALAQLLACQPQPRHLYGSTAIAHDDPQCRLCWPTATPDGSGLERQSDLAGPLIEIQSLTFLGLLVHRQLVQQIGLPDATLFLAGDDIDYGERARRIGARLFLAPSSILHHPLPARRTITVAGRRFKHLILPPWKRYYDVRNRVLVARRHYGRRLWTETLPGLLIRLGDSLRHDPDRWQQIVRLSARDSRRVPQSHRSPALAFLSSFPNAHRLPLQTPIHEPRRDRGSLRAALRATVATGAARSSGVGAVSQLSSHPGAG